jgi:cyclophilin family peptidyl-prolyl cis-trans isomerase
VALRPWLAPGGTSSIHYRLPLTGGEGTTSLQLVGLPPMRPLAGVVLSLCLVSQPTGATTSEFAADPVAALLRPTDGFWARQAPDRFRVRFATSEGNFVVEVDRTLAPLGADRLFNLVRAGFFDDSRFFRVRAGYIAQFGISGKPEVSSVWKARTLEDDPARASNKRGSIGYAMTGPDTRTTQLYINLVDNTHLDAQGFAPLGEVVEGLEVVDRLYAGYGEGAGGGMRGGKQGRIFREGNAYLDQAFPKLSKLERATVE